MKLKLFLTIGAISGISVAAVAAMVASSNSTGKADRGTKVSDYENVMNMSGVSSGGDDSNTQSFIQPFSDLGSFHSYSLPTYNSREYWGSFTAPMIIGDTETPRRFSKAFDMFDLYEVRSDGSGNSIKKSDGSFDTKAINFKALDAQNVHIKQYPGGLWQEFELDKENLTLQVNLRFTHAKVSSVKYKIINHSGNTRKFKFSWHGGIYKEFINRFKGESDSKSYIDPHPYKVNDQGMPLMIKTGSATPKLVYFTYDDSSKKYIEYTDAAEISDSNFANTFVDENDKTVQVYTPNSSFKVNKVDVRDNNLKAYKFVNKYKADDIANLNDPNNILKNTVSFSFNDKVSAGEDEGDWMGHVFNKKFQMMFPTDFNMNIKQKENSYVADMNDPIEVEGKGSNDFYVQSAFTFTSQDREGFTYQNETNGDKGRVVEGVNTLMRNEAIDKIVASSAFEKSNKRWEYYLENLLGSDKSTKTFKHRKVAVKATETLVNNWIGNMGLLQRDGIVPSRSIYYFSTSYWTWDSWKQAVASVNFDPKLAMDNIKALFDNQVINDKKKQHLVYLDEQNRIESDLGMLPDLTSSYLWNINWRDTKPPLSGWAVWNVYNTIKDRMWSKTDFRTGKKLKDEAINFLKFMYARLMAYHAWWYLNRDGDGNGINEYGATVSSQNWWGTNHSENDIAVATAWESGMDNAPRFDTNGAGPIDKGLKWTLNRNRDNSVSGFVLQQESVDLNSYMFAEKQFMVKIAKALQENGVKYEDIEGMKSGYLHDKLITPMKNQLNTRLKKPVIDKGIMQNVGISYEEDIKQFEKDGAFLKDYINNKMFDKQTGFYYDLRYEVDNSGNRIAANDHILSNRGMGPEGFIPLWANAADTSKGKEVRNNIMDPKGFNTFVPFPTAAYNNDKFEPDQYWRGPVWLDQAYFGVRALSNYKYKDESSYMVNKLFNNAQGLLDGGPIMENYNPLTGEQLNAKGFSWSSGMYMLMYENYIKGGR